MLKDVAVSLPLHIIQFFDTDDPANQPKHLQANPLFYGKQSFSDAGVPPYLHLVFMGTGATDYASRNLPDMTLYRNVLAFDVPFDYRVGMNLFHRHRSIGSPADDSLIAIASIRCPLNLDKLSEALRRKRIDLERKYFLVKTRKLELNGQPSQKMLVSRKDSGESAILGDPILITSLRPWILHEWPDTRIATRKRLIESLELFGYILDPLDATNLFAVELVEAAEEPIKKSISKSSSKSGSPKKVAMEVPVPPIQPEAPSEKRKRGRPKKAQPTPPVSAVSIAPGIFHPDPAEEEPAEEFVLPQVEKQGKFLIFTGTTIPELLRANQQIRNLYQNYDPKEIDVLTDQYSRNTELLEGREVSRFLTVQNLSHLGFDPGSYDHLMNLAKKPLSYQIPPIVPDPFPQAKLRLNYAIPDHYLKASHTHSLAVALSISKSKLDGIHDWNVYEALIQKLLNDHTVRLTLLFLDGELSNAFCTKLHPESLAQHKNVLWHPKALSPVEAAGVIRQSRALLTHPYTDLGFLGIGLEHPTILTRTGKEYERYLDRISVIHDYSWEHPGSEWRNIVMEIYRHL